MQQTQPLATLNLNRPANNWDLPSRRGGCYTTRNQAV